MKKWIKNPSVTLNESTKAKFYVALTRARYSVAIVADYSDGDSFIKGIEKYK